MVRMCNRAKCNRCNRETDWHTVRGTPATERQPGSPPPLDNRHQHQPRATSTGNASLWDDYSASIWCRGSYEVASVYIHPLE